MNTVKGNMDHTKNILKYYYLLLLLVKNYTNIYLNIYSNPAISYLKCAVNYGYHLNQCN